MTVYGLNSIIIGDTDMVGLNSHHFAIFLMSSINKKIALATSGGQKKPEVGECRRKGCRAFGQTWIS